MKGTQAAAARSGNRGKKFSMVAALGVDRMLVTRTVEGAFNSLSFYDFVTDDLVGCLGSSL